jgi:uncharacterized cupredoxin-like copper-binding protein
MLRRSSLVVTAAVTIIALSACGGDADSAGGGDATTSIEIVGTDTLTFEPTGFTVPAGEEVTVELTSEAAVEHDFVIEDVDGQDLDVAHADPGETETGTFTIDDAGTYQFFCSVPGHREAGMEGTLDVVEGD